MKWERFDGPRGQLLSRGQCWRAATPEGWLVCMDWDGTNGLTFVPDADHVWDPNAKQQARGALSVPKPPR